MEEMLTEELAKVQRLAADYEDSKEGVDTRLRQVESEVMQLKAMMSEHGGAGLGDMPAVKAQAVVPVIGIMGPFPEQFAHVERLVGAAAQLVHLDNKRGAGKVDVPPSVEWVIFNRFASHAQENGLRNAVGASHVIHVISGGISSMVRAVMDVVERVNREVCK